MFVYVLIVVAAAAGAAQLLSKLSPSISVRSYPQLQRCEI